MARADLLRKLFRGFKGGDDSIVLEAAWEIISDERKKQHVILANELTKILENGSATKDLGLSSGFEQLPKDSDRGLPLLEIRIPDRYLNDLVLSQKQYGFLERILGEFRQWDILEAHSLLPSRKLLFCGPPGCGKTATAEALANELGLPLLYVRFDSVISSLLGETASNLRKVFDYASRDSWVVLFDEFDAVGRSRSDVTEHGELKRVVNTFLQILDGFSGKSLIIAATNFEQSLDPALWRRFDEVINFEKPNESQILALISKKLGEKVGFQITKQGNVSRLSGMSHSDIERICLDALKRRVLAGSRSVTVEDFEEAIKKQEYRQYILNRNFNSNAYQVDDE